MKLYMLSDFGVNLMTYGVVIF